MRPKLAILVSFSGQGGVERMIANLSQSLAMAPIDLDILLIKAKGPAYRRVARQRQCHSFASATYGHEHLRSGALPAA